jgi:large subunit ribosomal protein L15
MSLQEVKAAGAKRKKRKRLGRGHGSGTGKTCGTGENGQRSRSGSFGNVYFEGGQTPLFRRLPKRGFSPSPNKPVELDVTRLNGFDDGTTVDIQVLREAGLVRKKDKKVKIIGNGKLEKRLTIKAAGFSAGAAKIIEEAGGKVERIQ